MALIFCAGALASCALAQTAEDREIKKVEKMDVSQQNTGLTMRLPVEYKGEGLRDPFKGASQEGLARMVNATAPTLEIQGIIWGGRLPQAIVNNKVVKVGDTVQEARIIDINKEGVTVFFGGAQYTILSPAVSQMKKSAEKKSSTRP